MYFVLFIQILSEKITYNHITHSWLTIFQWERGGQENFCCNHEGVMSSSSTLEDALAAKLASLVS